MKVEFHRTFVKQYDRLPVKVQLRFKERLKLFVADNRQEPLRDHPLTGEWLGHRSINVTGDFRAIYKLVDETAVFAAIGSHSQLYG